jgi:hypothetical protein
MGAVSYEDGHSAVIVPAQPGQMGVIVEAFEDEDGAVHVGCLLVPVIGFGVLYGPDGLVRDFEPDIIVPGGLPPDAAVGLLLPNDCVLTDDRRLFEGVDAFVEFVRQRVAHRWAARSQRVA